MVRAVSDAAVEEFRARLAGQLVLAPLTKGGNLPFRRLCVDFGCAVTVSEMAFARFLLKAGPHCSLVVHQCTRTHSPRPAYHAVPLLSPTASHHGCTWPDTPPP